MYLNLTSVDTSVAGILSYNSVISDVHLQELEIRLRMIFQCAIKPGLDRCRLRSWLVVIPHFHPQPFTVVVISIRQIHPAACPRLLPGSKRPALVSRPDAVAFKDN